MEVSIMEDEEHEWVREHWPKVEGVSFNNV
jgi:hypothetical protein